MTVPVTAENPLPQSGHFTRRPSQKFRPGTPESSTPHPGQKARVPWNRPRSQARQEPSSKNPMDRADAAAPGKSPRTMGVCALFSGSSIFPSRFQPEFLPRIGPLRPAYGKSSRKDPCPWGKWTRPDSGKISNRGHFNTMTQPGPNIPEPRTRPAPLDATHPTAPAPGSPKAQPPEKSPTPNPREIFSRAKKDHGQTDILSARPAFVWLVVWRIWRIWTFFTFFLYTRTHIEMFMENGPNPPNPPKANGPIDSMGHGPTNSFCLVIHRFLA